jgi:hypothetical protein
MPVSRGFCLPILQGVLPIKGWQVPAEFIAGYVTRVSVVAAEVHP